jgi:hypothetical protein
MSHVSCLSRATSKNGNGEVCYETACFIDLEVTFKNRIENLRLFSVMATASWDATAGRSSEQPSGGGIQGENYLFHCRSRIPRLIFLGSRARKIHRFVYELLQKTSAVKGDEVHRVEA